MVFRIFFLSSPLNFNKEDPNPSLKRNQCRLIKTQPQQQQQQQHFNLLLAHHLAHIFHKVLYWIFPLHYKPKGERRGASWLLGKVLSHLLENVAHPSKGFPRIGCFSHLLPLPPLVRRWVLQSIVNHSWYGLHLLGPLSPPHQLPFKYWYIFAFTTSYQTKIFNSHSCSVTRNQYTKGNYRFFFPGWNKKVLAVEHLSPS